MRVEHIKFWRKKLLLNIASCYDQTRRLSGDQIEDFKMVSFQLTHRRFKIERTQNSINSDGTV